MSQQEERRAVAARVRNLYDGHGSFDEIVSDFSDSADELVQELLDMVTHEPAATGLLGIGSQAHGAYMDNVRRLLNQLEQPDG